MSCVGSAWLTTCAAARLTRHAKCNAQADIQRGVCVAGAGRARPIGALGRASISCISPHPAVLKCQPGLCNITSPDMLHGAPGHTS